MEKIAADKLHRFYEVNLLENCVPFWLKSCVDKEYGGILTCLDREGKVYNDDKSVWFQGRACWTFSKLYNTMGKKQEWLQAAKSAYDFLVKHCFDADGRMFFTVTRDGRPLQKRRYMFSETFAIIACAEYYKASGDAAALERAKNLYHMVLDLYHNPSKTVPKINPATRTVQSHALPMILLSTTQTLREVDPRPEYEANIEEFVRTVLDNFFKPEEGALFETVGPKGERLNSPQGRCINPGHSIETSWFLMHEAQYRNDNDLLKTALSILDCSLNIGWDKEYGGIKSFVDIEGKPAEQLEWDMKLWWPHTEALYATLLAHHLTKNDQYMKWYYQIHNYAFEHFPDKEHGEWFGYLHYDGTVSNTLKGSMWKGPFHLPRALLLCTKLLENM